MKFFKKAAALFFCLALALSVMAVTALAAEPNNVDPKFKVTLQETTTATHYANVNAEADGANEYTSGNTISYDIYLEIADGSVHVNSFKFDVEYDSGAATLTIPENGVSAISAFSVAADNSAKYAFATNATAGEEITSTAKKIGSISFTLNSDTPGAKKTFSLTNFNVYATEKQDSFNANVTEASKTVEVDPQYTITFKKPVTNALNVITYSGSPEAPSYTVDAGGTSPTYKIAAGADDITPPTLNEYYTFKQYIVAASVGNWVKDATYTASELNTLLDTHTQYGDVTLNLCYEANEYSITFKVPTQAENGTFAFEEGGYTAYAESQTAFDAVDSITYTIEGKANKVRSGPATAVAAPTSKTAYDFVNYAVSGSGTNWATTGDNQPGPGASIALASLPYSIPEGLYGNVTLTAMYTPIDYTVSYVLGTNAKMNKGTAESPVYVADTDATKYTQTYNINTAANNYAFFPNVPTRDGYSFTGWTAAKTATSDKDYGVYGSNAAWPTEANGVNGTIASAGKYGDVTLTAHWEIVGKFAHKSYKYTASTNELMLFAVETVPETGAYTYNDNVMFTVDGKYKNAFTTGEVTDNYTIFAYIAPTVATDAAGIAQIKFDETKTKAALTYDGNVTGNKDGSNNAIVDAGDYGNVVAMLADSNYNHALLTVEARLKADMAVAQKDKTGEEGKEDDWTTEMGDASWFGTIDDVRAIMDIALGKTS